MCGFPNKDVAPLTYLHMLAFPLHMAMMTDCSFPFPAIGTVHLENAITQHRPVGIGETVSLTLRAENLRPQHQGQGVRHERLRRRWATSWCGSPRRRTCGIGKGDKEAGDAGHVVRAGLCPAEPTWRLPATSAGATAPSRATGTRSTSTR